MIKFVRIFFLGLTLFLTALLYGAEPMWLQMENGKNAVTEGRLGEAVLIFREVLKKNPDNPEAQQWLGFLYEKEGEFKLAALQFEKALENRKSLPVQEDAYDIMYHLSSVYTRDGNEKESLLVLNKIIHDASEEQVSPALRHTMVSLLQRSGIDKFFELYRPKAPITQKAHYLLGMYYFNEEHYVEALNHFIFSLGEPVRVMINTVKRYDPDYSYEIAKDSSPLELLLQRMRGNRRIAAYLKDISFFRSLLYTGESVVYSGSRKTGLQMVELVIRFSPELELRNRGRLFYIRY